MRFALRVLGYVIGVCTALFMTGMLYAAFTWWRASTVPLPDYAGEVSVQGLSGAVVVKRDQYAIPYIDAQSEQDAWFALGYAHAQDRLFQMDVVRRAMSGRLSELMGPLTLRVDQLAHIRGFPSKARETLEALPPRERQMVDAYVAGVNAYLSAGDDVRAPEHVLLHAQMEPWTPLDTVFVSFGLSRPFTDGGAMLREQFRKQAPIGDQALDYFQPFRSDTPLHLEASAGPESGSAPFESRSGYSNAWVLSGRLSESGLPLLANDPHMPVQTPGLTYAAHLSWPGREVVGVTAPGAPGFIMGRTNSIAFGVTFATGSVDTADFSILQRDPDDPDRYLTPVGARNYEIETVRIPVRFGDEKEFTVRRSPAGVVFPRTFMRHPIIDDDQDLVVLDRFDVTECECQLAGFLQLARADNAEEVIEAMSVFGGEPVNVLFADTEGDIGYVMPGGIPERTSQVGASVPDNPSARPPFAQLVAYAENPKLINPASGRIISANQAIAGSDYPHYLSDAGRDVNRARRIQELLDARVRHDLDSFQEMQLDTLSPAARDLLPYLRAATPLNEADRPLWEIVSTWDGRYDADTAAPLIFSVWVSELLSAIFADELGPLAAVAQGQIDNVMPLLAALEGDLAGWCDDRTTDGVDESCDALVAESLSRARERLETRWGENPDQWRWGQAMAHDAPHILFRGLPLLGDVFSRSLQMPGGPDSLRAALMPWSDTLDPDPPSSTPFMKMLVDMADPDAARFAFRAGQSGHFRSPHYNDLAQLWMDGQYISVDDPGPDARVLTLRPSVQ
ncbi:penicillin acylase family protein [Wenzhouxiangella limi]|uniref:Penicillin acylase family protein n=1 Tax=Wenzhouxiangella limi TaxID=2707351 RepID=A0A845UWN4_9GAMM|nr:penicillin acylase family protein [Wenzhouxiangella limi]NDY96263.1 penicillin acylase family protein [Wenzhouxiangella limi]